MSRRLRTVLAAVTVAAAVAGVQASPAAASPPITPGATAFSTPVFTGNATVRTTLALTGSLGGLLDRPLSAILDSSFTPLMSALQALSFNSAIGAALGVSSTYTAGTPDFQTTPGPAAFPGDPVPPAGCGVAAGLPCYQASSGLSPALGGLATIGLSRVGGYTQQVQNSADVTSPMFGRSQVSSPSVAVLPAVAALTNPVVSTSTIDSKAICPNDGSDPDATATASSVSILGGLVTFSVVDGDIASLQVNGTSYASLAAMPAQTIGRIGVVQYGGTAVKVSINLTPSEILSAIGLPAAVTSALLTYVPTSSISLAVIVGPRSALTTTSSVSTGLSVSVDLSGSLGFTLLGLVGATVTVPSGASSSNYGNVLDLRLAYATCTTGAYAGNPGASRPVPPALV